MKNASHLKRKNKNQRGQYMLEGVLLMVLFVGAATAIKDRLTERNVIGSLVAGPWRQIEGMMANGVWREKSQGESLHPQGNVTSRQGDSF